MGKIIVIKGADFSANAVSYNNSYTYTFVPKSSIVTDDGLKIYTMQSRANVLIPRSEALNPTAWSSTSTASLANAWSMIQIPTGAKRVKLSMTNTAYYYGLVVRNSNGAMLADSGWKQGGVDVIMDLTPYTTAVYISSTFKIGSAGTSYFTNETLEDVGWSITWYFE